ncbi:MAG: hydrogenase nickel incorporation protein HypB [Lentisphaeria bacterium]
MNNRQINVYRDLMGENEKWAAETRRVLADNNLIMLNLIGSPGCGKTTILENMVASLGDRFRFAVLEGDVETTNDAERLAALDVPVSQLITSGACHLEAKLVHTALNDLPLEALDIIFVENVGNLVCPAEFDVGEHAKIAVLSITEGEDKPIKYPLLFREAKAAILSKTDLLPHLPFDIDKCRDYIRRVNGNIPLFELSATKGIGLDEWIDWVAESAGEPSHQTT